MNNTSAEQAHQSPSMLTAWLVFLLAASFYLYEFILQVAPSVMAEPMMKTFGITAEGFGIVSAFYFYAYAPMQIPAGLLFDRYGPRKLMTVAISICALGSVFFALTDSILTAAAGRFLIGIGSACSFIGVLVLISRWFPPHYFAILAGIAQLMSSVGAMFGEMPLAALIGAVGWRNASYLLALLGFFLGLMIWLFVRDFPHQQTQSQPKRHIADEWLRLKAVCRHGYTWITGAYACTIWTPIAVFAALWGVPYLQEKYQISVIAASGMCSMIWLGIGIGSPLLGWLSDVLKSRRISLGLSAFMGLTACIILLYIPDVSRQMMYFVLLLLGLGSGGQTVSFAVVKDNNNAEFVGTASGFNNLSVLVGGALFQPFVGYMLHHAAGAVHLVNQVPVYPLENYQWALLVMPASYALSLFIVCFLMRESHPEHHSGG